MFAYNWYGSDYDFGEEILLDGAVDWEQAACRDGSGSLTELFFSDEIPDIALAKAICASCPLVEACLEGALVRREPAGVWGGQLFVEGAVVPFKRKRGRPPKNAPAALGVTGPADVASRERKTA